MTYETMYNHICVLLQEYDLHTGNRVKRGRKTITTSYFLDNFIHVNPQYLIDMIQALPGCTAYKPQSQTSPIYFEAPNGDDGILLPVRPPHNPSDDVSNEKTTS